MGAVDPLVILVDPFLCVCGETLDLGLWEIGCVHTILFMVSRDVYIKPMKFAIEMSFLLLFKSAKS